MTYAEKLAFETANEVFELDLICKRIDEFESRSVESTIQAAIIKAMQAQREACGVEVIRLRGEGFTFNNVYSAVVHAEVKP